MFRIDRHATFVEGHIAPGELIAESYFANHKYEGFDDILTRFLEEGPSEKSPAACCLAVAGPVTDNSVTLPNREGWIVDGTHIRAKWKIGRVAVVNDFLAQGYGVLTLTDDEVIPINDVPASRDGPIACVGAGTGLGECFCTRNANGKRLSCFPSEGGHAEWSPRHSLELELLTFLLNKFRAKHRVSVERVVSGHGLANIYEFLREHRDYYDKVDPNIDRQFEESPKSMKGSIVGKNARNNAVCNRAAETFTSAYGSEVGVAALKYLPTGGLYICGGIAAKNVDWIQSETFRHAMFDKGRVSFALRSIPVKLVTVENTGLRGAHVLAFHLLREYQQSSQVPIATSSLWYGSPSAAAARSPDIDLTEEMPRLVPVALSVTAMMLASAATRRRWGSFAHGHRFF